MVVGETGMGGSISLPQRKRGSSFFSMDSGESMRVLQSQAHRQLRERANGIDLTQYSMLTENQFLFLVKLLGCAPGKKVLDMGSGIGRVAWEVHQRTGANLTGIEIDRDMIREAMPSTGEKFTILEGSFDDLPWTEPEFDAVYSVDTLYFSQNLSALLQKVFSILKPGGKFIVFWSQVLNDTADLNRLLPDNTDLAEALKEHRIPYQHHNFSDEEVDYWKRANEALIALEADFRKEGEIEFYNMLLEETETMLERILVGRIKRYCYIAEKVSN